MLHRAKVLAQLQSIEQTLFHDITPVCDEAYRVWQRMCQDPLFKEQVLFFASQLSLPVWQGELADSASIVPYKQPYAVIGVDGSQIFPDRHQGSSCFLINVGTVFLRYGLHASAQLTSQPYVFSGSEQQADRLLTFTSMQETISLQRHTLELRHGLAALQQHKAQEIPQILLFDGSLLFWHLAHKPEDVQCYYAGQYTAIFEELYQEQALVAGYISLPHSKELVNLLKFSLSGCDPLVYKELTMLDLLLDKHIIAMYLEQGQRTGIFKSNAVVASLYPDHMRPYFFYIRGAQEVVRVEVPAWIARCAEKVALVASLIVDQMDKGHGYPVSLAEAHEQAVVKGVDRDFFYHLIDKLSIAQRRVVLPSQKSLKKRTMSI